MFLDSSLFIRLITQRFVCIRGWESLCSHVAPCFLGKDNAWGQGSGVSAEGVYGGLWVSGRHFLAESAPAPLSGWLFLSRMSIMSCHPRQGKRNIQEVHYQTACGSMNGQQTHTALARLPPSGAEGTSPP